MNGSGNESLSYNLLKQEFTVGSSLLNEGMLLFPLFLLHFFFFNSNLNSVVMYLMEKELATHSSILA